MAICGLAWLCSPAMRCQAYLRSGDSMLSLPEGGGSILLMSRQRFCHHRYNICGAPQEYTNEEIDRELYEGNLRLPHLHLCI